MLAGTDLSAAAAESDIATKEIVFMKKLLLASVALVAAAQLPTAASAQTVVLDLSQIAQGSLYNPVQIGAYVLTPQAGPYSYSAAPTITTNDDGLAVIAGTDFGRGDDTYLSRADGGVFTLDSITIGLLDYYGATGQGVGVPGGVGVGLNYQASGTPATINFGSTFTNVTSIDLDALAGAYFANITVSSAVPEPATWAMMLAGFGMIGFAARRRSSVKTTVAYA